MLIPCSQNNVRIRWKHTVCSGDLYDGVLLAGRMISADGMVHVDELDDGAVPANIAATANEVAAYITAVSDERGESADVEPLAKNSLIFTDRDMLAKREVLADSLLSADEKVSIDSMV